MSASAFCSLLLLVVLSASSAPLAAAAAMDPIERAALKGTTITLSCPRKQEHSEDEVMKWIKGRDVIFEGEGMVMSEKWKSDKFDLSIETPSSYNLTINAIEMDDKDAYVCLLWNMDSDEKEKLAEFDVVVLEQPECSVSGGGNNKLVRGQSYDFTCSSNVNDVTLLWSIGTAEKNIGDNLVGIEDTEATYKTTKTLVADASLQGQEVECELQHPAWSVQEGVLKCSVGAFTVENAVQILCEEDKQKDDGIVCVVKNRDDSSAAAIREDEIKWVVKGQDASTAKSVDASMIEPLVDGSGFTVTLKSDKKGEMHALVVGEETGPWQKMPAKSKSDGSGSVSEAGEQTDNAGGSQTGMIIVIVVIAILLVAIVVLVVLWKRGVIFSPSKGKEVDAEKGAPKLNGVTYNNGGPGGVNGIHADEKTLLTNKDNSNVVDEKKKGEEERRSSNASSEDDKKLIIDSDSGKTKNSEIDA